MLVDRLYDIIEPITRQYGLELVEVQYRQEQHGWILRIIIHKDEGVSVDDCARVSREVGHILDVEDVIPYRYQLEVSSPGLDRPLTVPRDFERNLGKKIKVTLLDDQAVVVREGTIHAVDGNEITLKSADEPLKFSCDQVKKARLVIEF